MQISRPVLIGALKKLVAFIPRVKTSETTGVITIIPMEDSIKLILAYPEASIETTLGALCTADEPSFNISGSKLLSIVSTADKEIQFSVEETFLVIRSGNSIWKEPLPSAGTYAIKMPEEKVCSVDTYTLLTSMNLVKYAIDSDSVRPALFMLDVVDGRIRACNGYQYHEVTTKVDDLTFSISGGMSDSFCAVLRYFDGAIDFYSDSSYYYFKNGNDIIATKKLSSKFPDLDRLLVRPLKSSVPALLKIDKDKLVRAIKQARNAIDDNYPYLEVHVSKSEVLVRGTQKSGAEAATKIDGTTWATKPRVLTFNVRHLISTLNSLNDGELELRLGEDTKTKKSPMVIEGSGTWSMLNQVNLTQRA